MSDSMPTLTSLRQASQAALDKAQATHANITSLLDALPQGTPAPNNVNDFGYCAVASMRFDLANQALFDRLLELYPPVPLVRLYGNSQTIKPASYVRDEEKSWAILELYPVMSLPGRANSYHRQMLRWWTNVAGKSVEMTLGHDGSVRMLPRELEEKYECDGDAYRPKLAEPLPGKGSSLGRWADSWLAYCEEQHFSAKQKQFLMAILNWIRRYPETPFTDADLPQPMYFAKGGTALAIPEGIEFEAALEAMQTAARRQLERTQHAFDNIGDFRASFTAEEVQSLLTFAEERRLALAVAASEVERDFDVVQKAFADFFATQGAPSSLKNEITVRRVHQAIQDRTGLRFQLSWLHSPRTSYAKPEVSIRVVFDKPDVFRDFSVPCVPGKSLLPQDVPARFAS